MIPLFKVAMSESAQAAVSDVLASGFIGQGAKVEAFEKALRARLGTPFVSTVNSATSGLTLALRLALGDSRPGDGEVLSTPLTFVASNWAILANGLRIRWVDVDPATLNIDLDDLARKISPATRAVVVVHWAGYPVDLNKLRAVLDRAEKIHGHRPAVIEDCAQAWGATFDGKPLGNHGNTAVYSFQAVKHLTCGDGGLIVMPDQAEHRRARLLRWFGYDRDEGAAPRGDQDIAVWGYKFHMNDISAAIGLANLDLAEEIVRKHRENARRLDMELAGVPGLELTERAADRKPSFWVYPVKVEDRSSFIGLMKDAGITASSIDVRNDAHTCVREYTALLPGMDEIAQRMVCLPVGWWLTDDNIDHIVSTVRKGW
ncbi:DegT/DnrJ/EryC1/StrS family aminotransferase [Nonomuraea sp. NPDC059007]|uniref:DegT/DnrJ/EryC1/StrS family aminotransferase n=1 Tax=Nonomuraea sp. NPDC059007 TaxID=3346692 RepID=UPI0036D11EDC